jgi:hypothetical protein
MNLRNPVARPLVYPWRDGLKAGWERCSGGWEQQGCGWAKRGGEGGGVAGGDGVGGMG